MLPFTSNNTGYLVSLIWLFFTIKQILCPAFKSYPKNDTNAEVSLHPFVLQYPVHLLNITVEICFPGNIANSYISKLLENSPIHSVFY